MPRHRPTRHQKMSIRNLMGRNQSQVPKKRRRATHQPHRHHTVQRLEQSSWMYIHCARTTPRVLRVWKQGSRCSALPSSTEKGRLSLHIKRMPGSISSSSITSSPNIPNSPSCYAKALTQAYDAYMLPKPQTTAPPYTHIPNPTSIWSQRNSSAAAILVHAPNKKSNTSLALFNRHPSPWFPNPESQENSVLYITFHIL